MHLTGIQEASRTQIGNRWFENVAQFRYLGTTITNHKLIQEKLRGD
jgi:hypothetical protein